MIFRQERRRVANRWQRDLDRQRITQLATYNSEKDRGLVHTADWEAYMAAEQAWFEGLPRPS